MENQKAQKINALIIDDETDTCFLLGNMLKQKNVQSSFAGSLSDADKFLQRSYYPSIVFLDNHLPDGSGMNYVHRLKEAYPQACIVMITAHDNESDRKKAFQAGVDFFTGKPFTREFIYNTLEKMAG